MQARVSAPDQDLEARWRLRENHWRRKLGRLKLGVEPIEEQLTRYRRVTWALTAVPAVNKHLYSAQADPNSDIAAALNQARLEHKRIILDFGGDWCGDCQVLDIYLHQPPNLQLLDKNFLLVHVDIGHFDKNLDITEKYNIPLKKGVPALAVLDANGKLLYSQQAAEFGDMRYMYATSVTDFLNQWKA